MINFLNEPLVACCLILYGTIYSSNSKIVLMAELVVKRTSFTAIDAVSEMRPWIFWVRKWWCPLHTFRCFLPKHILLAYLGSDSSISMIKPVMKVVIYVSGCCYSRLLKDSHICVERAMHHDCPVCFEVKTEFISVRSYNDYPFSDSFSICAVPFWYNEWHHSLTLWPHHTSALR